MLLVLLVFSASNYASANSSTDLVLREISQLRADMNKRFEQIDKRFEQTDKRFEQVEKRLDFLQQLFYVVMALVLTSPFLAFYLKEKSQGKMQALIFALREASQKDENLSKALKIAGLD